MLKNKAIPAPPRPDRTHPDSLPNNIAKDLKKGGSLEPDRHAILLDSNMPTYYYIKNFNFLIEQQKRNIGSQPLTQSRWGFSVADLEPVEINHESDGLKKLSNRLKGVITEAKKKKYDLKERQRADNQPIEHLSDEKKGEFFDKDLKKIGRANDRLAKVHSDLQASEYIPSLFFSIRNGTSNNKFKSSSIDLGVDPSNHNSSIPKIAVNARVKRKFELINKKNPLSSIIKPIYRKNSSKYIPSCLYFFIFRYRCQGHRHSASTMRYPKPKK
jgi:hypothetical protein